MDRLEKDAPKDKATENLADDLLELFVRNIFASGDITEGHLKDRAALRDRIKKLLSTSDLVFVIDHRDGILAQGNLYVKRGDFDFAKLFFAIFFEHTINHLIEVVGRRRKFDQSTRKEVIRNINLNGKCTWLLKLLDLKPFNKKHQATILSLADQRNAFIHYKWSEATNLEKPEEAREMEFVKKIKAAVAYLKRYESLVLYNKSLSKIKKATQLKKQPNSSRDSKSNGKEGT